MDEKRVNYLLLEVKRIAQNNVDLTEVINLTEKSNLDNSIKVMILTELYRYSFYKNAKVSIDPREDYKFKVNALSSLKEELINGNLSKETLDNTRAWINKLRDYIDNPLVYIDSEIEHFNNNLEARF